MPAPSEVKIRITKGVKMRLSHEKNLARKEIQAAAIVLAVLVEKLKWQIAVRKMTEADHPGRLSGDHRRILAKDRRIGRQVFTKPSLDRLHCRELPFPAVSFK